MVGIVGFEPTTPCSQSRCANQAALHPVTMGIIAHITGIVEILSLLCFDRSHKDRSLAAPVLYVDLFFLVVRIFVVIVLIFCNLFILLLLRIIFLFGFRSVIFFGSIFFSIFIFGSFIIILRSNR